MFFFLVGGFCCSGFAGEILNFFVGYFAKDLLFFFRHFFMSPVQEKGLCFREVRTCALRRTVFPFSRALTALLHATQTTEDQKVSFNIYLFLGGKMLLKYDKNRKQEEVICLRFSFTFFS